MEPLKIKFINEEDKLNYYKTDLLDIEPTTFNYIKILAGVNDESDSTIKLPNQIIDDKYTDKLFTQMFDRIIPVTNRTDIFIKPNMLIGKTNRLLGESTYYSLGFYITNKQLKDITVPNNEELPVDYSRMIAANFKITLYENDNEVNDQVKIKFVKMHYRPKIIAGSNDFIEANQDKLLIMNLKDIQDNLINKDLIKTNKEFRMITEDCDFYKQACVETKPFIQIQDKTDLINYYDEKQLTVTDDDNQDSVLNLYNLYKDLQLTQDNDKQCSMIHININTPNVNRVRLQIKIAYQVFTKVNKDNKNIVYNNQLILRDKDQLLINTMTILFKTFYYLGLAELRDLLLKDDITTLNNYTKEEMKLIETIKKKGIFITVLNIITNLIDNDRH